jgi:hypothetical protein
MASIDEALTGTDLDVVTLELLAGRLRLCAFGVDQAEVYEVADGFVAVLLHLQKKCSG